MKIPNRSTVILVIISASFICGVNVLLINKNCLHHVSFASAGNIEKMRNCDKVKAEDYVRPSLTDTAKLAYELTSEEWSDIGFSESESDPNTNRDVVADHDDDPFGFKSIESYADDILALLLIRFLAILQYRSETSESTTTSSFPHFRDLSTTTITRTIMADEAKRRSTTANSINSTKEMDALEWPTALSNEVVYLLRSYIIQILSLYRDVFYHNSIHAHHVFLSANKLLDMMLCEYQWESITEEGKGNKFKNGEPNKFETVVVEEEETSDHNTEEKDDTKHNDNTIQKKYTITEPVAKKTIRSTYGIKSDPFLQFAFLFSALIHDADHKGVGNQQLVLEMDELAILYNDQSVAEQRSLAVSFTYFMKEEFIELRNVLFGGQDKQEFIRFRSNVIDLVLCTDTSSQERVQIVKSKLQQVFGDNFGENFEYKNKMMEYDLREKRIHTITIDNEEEKENVMSQKKEKDKWKVTRSDPVSIKPVQHNSNNLMRKVFEPRSSRSSLPSRKPSKSKSDDDSSSIQGDLSNTNSDQPNALGAIVVLEQMLKAADVAANMQVSTQVISFIFL